MMMMTTTTTTTTTTMTGKAALWPMGKRSSQAVFAMDVLQKKGNVTMVCTDDCAANVRVHL